MLIRFDAKNYRSIRERVELSMVAIDDREEARPAPQLGASLLPVAAVFGPNASGKSNVVAALSWVRDAVQHSLRFWEDEIPIDPFAFGTGPTMPSEFSVEMTIKGVRFEYVLALTQARILYEGLFHYPEKNRRRIFERDGLELKLQRGLGGISGTRKLLTHSALALSIARRFDEPLVSDFARKIQEIQTHRGLRFSEGDIPLNFSSESEGTKTSFHLIGPVLTAPRRGSVIILDELDANLHPILSAELLTIFHSPATNPRDAQLIFTSHATSLLNHLNRDEIWLTEKRDDGSTHLGALAEFAGERVRNSRNLEDAYLRGRFGALPHIDQSGIRRALGLIG
ncbi:AAA family ATPase [Rhizohabitans arisaemae]|uniref:AAA family ATPase n=1 Tax=Rhizohabitans arisaemae TaxID=2720610 RepID=UPI0024B21139|nr:ATP-binding protein [Rhizohabitans arisaemae]